MTFAHRLREHRHRSGYSQQECALRVGCDQAHWSRYERGIYQPSAGTLGMIARVLEMTPHELGILVMEIT